MKIIAFIFLLFIACSIHGQSISIENFSKEKTETKFITCILSTVYYPEEDVIELKNELMGWDTKVISVLINSDKTLTIKHNTLFNQIEFSDVLDKYHMSTKSIISCSK